MPRHEFSTKTKRLASERAGNRCEATGEVYGLDPGRRCNANLKGKRKEFDHYPLPAGMEGSDALDNCVVCCTDCHGHKTRTYDLPMQAKDKRIRDLEQGIRSAPKMRGAGFRKAPPQHTATRPLKRKGDTGEAIEMEDVR